MEVAFKMNRKINWKEIFVDWERSGLSVTAYCKTNHISVSAFYRNKPLSEEKNDDISFSPVVISQDERISFTVNDVKITCNRHDLVFIMEAIK